MSRADDIGRRCARCEEPVGTPRRAHTCRICDGIFCGTHFGSARPTECCRECRRRIAVACQITETTLCMNCYRMDARHTCLLCGKCVCRPCNYRGRGKCMECERNHMSDSEHAEWDADPVEPCMLCGSEKDPGDLRRCECGKLVCSGCEALAGSLECMCKPCAVGRDREVLYAAWVMSQGGSATPGGQRGKGRRP